jgi:2-oxoglutarate ferredoxin oxidoreductase subunit beta
MEKNLSTKAKITWCPGCPNNQILVAFRGAATELAEENKIRIENLVATAGIGCHGKIAEYLNMNTYTSQHGRAIASATGIKLGNPDLTVVAFVGDGDAYAEGLEHLVHAARRNSDIKVFVHDNQMFALTTGQTTPTSPKGTRGKSTPAGSIEEPLEPLGLMLAAGASFVARTFAAEIQKTKEIMKAAMLHRGFAFVDIIQPCITFLDTREYFKERVWWLKGEPAKTIEAAMQKIKTKNDLSTAPLPRNSARQSEKEKVPCGIFYKVSRPTFEEEL